MARKPTVSRAYPEPTGGPIDKGLDKTSHKGSTYPQPNSANSPDPSSTAPPGVVPGPGAYSVNLAGAPPENQVSVKNPGVTSSGNAGAGANK